MIRICDFEICTGCQACKEICPKGAITMTRNDKGAIYPFIDSEKCIDCGLCVKICPSLNAVPKHPAPKLAYACWLKTDRKRRKLSTSGGIAYILSKWIIERGGYFFGCRFIDNVAVHTSCNKIEDLKEFQGSKYVHSDVKNTYSEVRQILRQNKEVLFVGTPCQIAGLKAYLRKDYENLYLVDLVCHGVPTPKILEQRILDVESKEHKKVTNIKFRFKAPDQFNTINLYSFSDNTNLKINSILDPYYKLFVKNYTLRDNCFKCQYSTTERVSDLTIADFWNYHPSKWKFRTYRKGTSLLLQNSEKGKKLFSYIQDQLMVDTKPIEQAIVGNRNLIHPQIIPQNYEDFWNDYFNNMSLEHLADKYCVNILSNKRKFFNTRLYLRLIINYIKGN